jgi:hypothetical protein
MTKCRTCHKPICGHSDAEYAGIVADMARAELAFMRRESAPFTESSRPVSPLTDRTSSGGTAQRRPASVVGER